jgi:hypothetical protein
MGFRVRETEDKKTCARTIPGASFKADRLRIQQAIALKLRPFW